MEDRRVWLSKRETALLAGVSVRTVERAIASGKLRAAKTNGTVRIHRRWVSAWLAAVLVFALLYSPKLACSHHRAPPRDALLEHRLLLR